MSYYLRILLLLSPLAACVAPTGTELLEDLYAESCREIEGRAKGSPGNRVEARLDRVAEVQDLIEAGVITTNTDRLYAATILLDSDRSEDLDVAAELALQAAEQGDSRALPIAAEAIDRALLLRDLPQKYATQYIFDPLTRSWSLYRWDPDTTDVERAAMGVAPIATALRRADLLNQR
jgi:hypothetical protein